MKAFLASVDPFHDKPITGLQGWPDQESSESVIRHWKVSHTVSGFEEGGSCLLYSWPIANQRTVNYATRSLNVISSINLITELADVAPVALYKFSAAQASTDVLPLKQAAWTDDLSQFLADGPSRLIGMGVEIRDVTAEIYKQGTCTVFETPQALNEHGCVTVTAQSGQYGTSVVPVTRLNRYPIGMSEMLKFPSTQQWEAKEGAYIVVNHNSTDNDAIVPYYTQPLVCSSTQIDVPNVEVPPAWPLHIGKFIANGTGPATFDCNYYMNVNSKGIYMSGLNTNSTFTITVCYYLESFPLSESLLLPLASPSAPFDPKALALISMVNREMPVGCRIRDNPSGEWFWEALTSVLPVVGTVASGIFPEFSPLIAPAAALATSAANKKLQDTRKANAERARKKEQVKKEIKQEIKRELKK